MNNKLIFLITILIFSILGFSCSSNITVDKETVVLTLAESQAIEDPEPWMAVPSQNQLAWHELEYFSLICFGLNTYTEQEWGFGNVSSKLFNPSDLDTDQWAQVCSDAGMKGIILVAKHHDGFCLWPTQTTDYSVKSSPWKNGEGDVVADLAASCQKYNLKLGLYISPWDRNHAEYGQAGYVEAYHEQWNELLTQYGSDLFEVWFDGANGGDGWYGGANDHRAIAKDYYQFDQLFANIDQLAPNAVLFGGSNINSVRWVGNESGTAGQENWSRFDEQAFSAGSDYQGKNGIKSSLRWKPVEADTPLLSPHAWYYHSGLKPKSDRELVDIWYKTIGRNSALNIGIAIGPDGQITAADEAALVELKRNIDQDFDQEIEYSEVTLLNQNNGFKSEFFSQNLTDSDTLSHWTGAEQIQNPIYIVNFDKQQWVNRIVLQEPIYLGQRVHSFNVDYDSGNGRWRRWSREKTIGYKRILRLSKKKVARVRIQLNSDAPQCGLSTLHFYFANNKVDKPLTALSSDLTFYHSKVVKSQWTVELAGDETVDHLFDEDPSTFVEFSVKGQDVLIDLRSQNDVSGMYYIPRRDGGKEGTLYHFELYISDTSDEMGVRAFEGRFSNIENSVSSQLIRFPEVTGRYIRIRLLHNVEGQEQFSGSELDFIMDQK